MKTFDLKTGKIVEFAGELKRRVKEDFGNWDLFGTPGVNSRDIFLHFNGVNTPKQ